jgi:hypothetical protein
MLVPIGSVVLEINAFIPFFSLTITSAKNSGWNVSLQEIFVLVRIQGLLILVRVGLAVLKMCAILHVFLFKIRYGLTNFVNFLL